MIDSGLIAGQPSWTVVKREQDYFKFHYYTHRLADSRRITQRYIGEQDFIDAAGLRDGNAAEARLLTLAVNDENVSLLRTYQLPQGDRTGLRWALTESHESLDLETLGDINYDGVSDYAVLGKHRSTDETVVQVRNGNDGLPIKDVAVLNPDWTPEQLLSLPAFPGWMAPKIGVLATNEAGQIVVSVLDLYSKQIVNDLFFLNANWTPIEALALPSFGDTMAAEIGLCARHKTSGKIVVMMKDAASGILVNRVFPLGSDWEVSKVIVMRDMNSNGASELAILAAHKESGQIAIEIRDSATDDLLKTLKPLGSNWTPADLLAYGIGTGQQLVIAAEHKTADTTVVQTIAVDSGAVTAQAFVH